MNVSTDYIKYVTLTNASLNTTTQDPLMKYKLSDQDAGVSDADIYYSGYLDIDGNWYIMKHVLSAGTYRFVAGTSGYTTNWTGRAGLTYGYFDATF